MTSAGGLVPLVDAAEHPASSAPLRVLPPGCAPPRRSRSRAASATQSRSTWAGPAPTCAWSRAACRSRPRRGRSAGSPIRLPALAIHTIGAGGGSVAAPGCRWCAGGRPARARAPIPDPRATGGAATAADGDRRRPRARPHPCRPRRSPGSGASSVDAARAALQRGRGDRRRGDRGGGRGDGTRGPGGERRAGCRSPRPRAGGVRRRRSAPRVLDRGPRSACAPVVVPPRAGVFSAVGLLCAPEQRELVQSWATPCATEGLAGARAATSPIGSGALLAGWRTSTSWLDCRYAGQSHELTVRGDRRLPGRARAAQRVRAARCAGRGDRAAGTCHVPGAVDARRPAGVDRGPTVRGPAVVAEPDCTVWIPAGWRADAGTERRMGRAAAREPGRAADPRSRDSRRSPTRWARCCGAAAFSPNIKERADCSAALFTAAGELLAQAEHIPVHLGSMPASVTAAIDHRDPCADAAQRPVRGWHPPQRPHDGRRRCSQA